MTRSRISRALLRTAVPAAAIAAGLAFAGPASASTVVYGAYDQDGNGYIDTYSFDASGDGYDDVLAFDYDETGYVEQVAVDFDLDGYVDAWAWDFDEDGSADQVAGDTNLDAVPDIWGDDSDFDGYVDTVYFDYGGDGVADEYEYADPASPLTQDLQALYDEAQVWVYWDVTYDGSGFESSDSEEESTESLLGNSETAKTAKTATQDAGDLVRDALHDLLPGLI